jgi:outer membrane protein TolC
LKLDDAIQRGLLANLGLLARDTTSQTVRAERMRALSALLPQVTGTLGETVEQINLATLGFSFKFPPIPGGTVLIYHRAGERVVQGF